MLAADAPPATHIYCNSYQSWGFTGSVAAPHPQPRHTLPDLFAGAFHLGGEPPPSAAPDLQRDAWKGVNEGYYKSDSFTALTSNGYAQNSCHDTASGSTALDCGGGEALVVGYVTQRKQFGVITADKTLTNIAAYSSLDNTLHTASSIASLTSETLYLQLLAPHNYDTEVLADYLDTVAAVNHARPVVNTPTNPLSVGWCSWYDYYEKITPGNLTANATTLESLTATFPCNTFVVDDGYMTAWGDWDSLKPGYTDMRALSDDIREKGFKPGVWLAPFAADKHSKIAKLHPEWIIKAPNSTWRAANSANCAKWFYGLDASNPEVIEHVKKFIRRAVEDWGFDVLKLDFLYASCLKGER